MKGRYLIIFAIAVIFLHLSADKAFSQRRDFVTDKESDVIREYQEIDRRIDALMKMIDRRLAAAKIPGSTWKVPKKDEEMWGPEPTGTKLELLSDIRRILQKAIDDIDDIASREHNAIEENNVGGKLFPKAVRSLAAAATRFGPIFENEAEKATDQRERGVLLDSIESCKQIIEATANLPAETPNNAKKQKKKNDASSKDKSESKPETPSRFVRQTFQSDAVAPRNSTRTQNLVRVRDSSRTNSRSYELKARTQNLVPPFVF